MRSGTRKTTAASRHLLFNIFNTSPDNRKFSGLATATKENPVLDAVFNSDLMAIAIADDHNDFIEVNTGFCSLFGFTKTELLGKPLEFLLPSIQQQPDESTVTIAIKASETVVAFNGVLRHSCKNGGYKDVEISTQSIDHNGKKVSLILAVDITGKKLAEERIKYSEARLIEAQEVAKVGSWETDLSTLAVTWSLQTYRIFEIEPGSFATSHPGFLKFVHPDDRAMVDKAFTDSLHNNDVNVIEHRICTAGSKIKIVEERWRIFRNQEGLPVRATGTCRDITDQKLAAQKILDSELKYRSLIEQATDAICITDATMRIIDINPIGCQLLGYSKEEFLKLTLADLFFAEDLVTNPFKTDALQTGKVVSNERRFKRKNGSSVELEINVKWLDDGRFVVFGRDITARKLADMALQAAYNEKNTILESIADAFFAVDKNWTVTYWNKEAEKMLHTPKHTVLGRHLWEVFSDSIDSISCKQYQLVLTTKQPVIFEDYYQALNKWFEISAYPSASGLSVYFKDITERKQAAQLIIESEAKYRTLFEQNVAGVYQTTIEGVILNCNDAFAKMLKYDSPKELLLKNAGELYFSPAERNDFVNTVITQKKIHNYESTLKCKDGTSLHFIENISLRKDDLTGEAFFDGILIDISEKKQAELLLKESNERYNLISKATNDMVWDWDLATGKVYRNKEGWRKIFRTAPNEIENGLTGAWEERIHPEDLEKVQRVTDAIHKAEKNFFEVECRVRRDDGTYAYVHDRAYIVRNAGGIATRLIGATQDITGRKEAEAILKASEERYRYLFDNNPASIFIWDIDTFKVLEVNDTASKVCDFNKKEFLNKTVLDICLPGEHEKIRQLANAARKDPGFRKNTTCRHISKSGAVMYMDVALHGITFKGRPGVLSLATNITEKVHLEKMLETEKLAKQKEITAAVISAQEEERQELGSELHDNINQVLAGSLLYLGLAKKDLKDEHAYLTEAELLVSSAIDEIRKLSHSLIPPSLTQSEFLEALSNIIQATEKSSGIMICLQAGGFDESMASDKMKLNIYRIIQEQFTNILKHAQAEKIMVHLTREDEKTILSVKDDGKGFDTAKKSGGVGLMNIRTRASLFNGEVTIISSPGKGCELRVVFNASPE
ncbi:sensor histidine kinase [Ferruginibacter profundus]